MKKVIFLFSCLFLAQLSYSEELDELSISETFDYIYFDGKEKYTLISLDEKKLITSTILSYSHPLKSFIFKDYPEAPIKIISINLISDISYDTELYYVCNPTTAIIDVIYLSCDIHISSMKDLRIL